MRLIFIRISFLLSLLLCTTLASAQQGVRSNDGDLVSIGANADSAVGDATGTVNAHIRQLDKLFSAITFGDVNNSASAAGLLNTLGVCRYDSTQPTLTSGRWSACQISARGSQLVTPGVEGFAVSTTQTTSPWIVAGGGTAGSAATGVVTVQGIASMTKLLVTPDANSAVNLAQVAGTTISQTNPVPTVFPGTLVSGAVTSAMTGTTSTSVVSGTGSNYLYITNCVTSNGSTTVSTDILLQDGSGGTTLYVLPAPAAATATTGGGGSITPFPVPLKVPTSGNALYAANVTTGSSTKISCSGFRSTVSY